MTSFCCIQFKVDCVSSFSKMRRSKARLLSAETERSRTYSKFSHDVTETIDSSEFYEVLQHLNTFITRDDVVSQRLKFGSAFLSYSWESKNSLFFQLSCIPSPSRTNCVIFIGCNFESRAIQVGLHKENKDTASAKKGELCLLVS